MIYVLTAFGVLLVVLALRFEEWLHARKAGAR